MKTTSITFMGKPGYSITDNLSPQFISSDTTLKNNIPASIKIITEPGMQVELPQFIKFVEAAIKKEVKRRLAIVNKIRSAIDIPEALLHQNKSVQPWILFFTKRGGLPIDMQTGDFGLISCTSVQNHGVYWERTKFGVQSALITANSPGKRWGEDKDIGHEISHATFAPIAIQAQKASNSNLKLSYLYTEIAVVIFRGEHRETPTGLPALQSRQELLSFLQQSHHKYSSVGFDYLFEEMQSVDIPVSLQSVWGYKLASSCLQALNSRMGTINEM